MKTKVRMSDSQRTLSKLQAFCAINGLIIMSDVTGSLFGTNQNNPPIDLSHAASAFNAANYTDWHIIDLESGQAAGWDLYTPIYPSATLATNVGYYNTTLANYHSIANPWTRLGWYIAPIPYYFDSDIQGWNNGSPTAAYLNIQAKNTYLIQNIVGLDVAVAPCYSSNNAFFTGGAFNRLVDFYAREYSRNSWTKPVLCYLQPNYTQGGAIAQADFYSMMTYISKTGFDIAIWSASNNDADFVSTSPWVAATLQFLSNLAPLAQSPTARRVRKRFARQNR